MEIITPNTFLALVVQNIRSYLQMFLVIYGKDVQVLCERIYWGPDPGTGACEGQQIAAYGRALMWEVGGAYGRPGATWRHSTLLPTQVFF